MNNLSDRQRSQEAKFVLDEDLKFKINARRNRLLGEWAGSVLGKSREEAGEYAKTVIGAGLDGGQEAVLKKLNEDLVGKSSDLTILAKIEELGQTAREQVLQEISI